MTVSIRAPVTPQYASFLTEDDGRTRTNLFLRLSTEPARRTHASWPIFLAKNLQPEPPWNTSMANLFVNFYLKTLSQSAAPRSSLELHGNMNCSSWQSCWISSSTINKKSPYLTVWRSFGADGRTCKEATLPYLAADGIASVHLVWLGFCSERHVFRTILLIKRTKIVG